MTNVRARTAEPHRAPAYVGALVAVALSTVLGLWLAPRWGDTAVDLLYIPAVLAAAVAAGLRPALVAVTASALAYNYFFTEPQFTFRIDSPNDVVTVLILFAVALVTSDLAARMRRQARLARAEADRNATIAGLAGRLLTCAGETAVAEVATREIGAVFGCNTAILTGQPDSLVIAASAPAPVLLTPADLAAAALALSGGQPAGRGVDRAVPTEWQFHAVVSGAEPLAAFGLARDDGAPPVRREGLALLASLLDQVALALDRARLEAANRDFVRSRERDRIRSALLSSIGRDLTPPLKEIGRVVAAMRRSGAGDRELIGRIGGETARLERYLDTLADLDSASDQQPLQIGGVTIDIVRRTVTRDGAPVHLTPKEFALLAELAKHPGTVLSHAHLLRAVWGPAHEDQIDYLRVAVRALRQKLEADPAAPKLLLNKPAVGYWLAA